MNTAVLPMQYLDKAMNSLHDLGLLPEQGSIARRKLKNVLIAGGIGVVAVALLTKFGIIGPATDQWVQSSVGWASDNMDKVQGYIAALLPSATAAGSGLYLGFRRKRKPR